MPCSQMIPVQTAASIPGTPRDQLGIADSRERRNSASNSPASSYKLLLDESDPLVGALVTEHWEKANISQLANMHPSMHCP
jgi:hypothetical protein